MPNARGKETSLSIPDALVYLHPNHDFCVPNLEQFWTKVDVKGKDECWPWLAGTYKEGYGSYRIPGPHSLVASAHRVAYTLVVGAIPSKLEVLHSCDNPSCVNPFHLQVGSHQDNMSDMVRKGRSKRKFPLEVIAKAEWLLINTSLSQQKIADRVGISRSYVEKIKVGVHNAKC